MNGASGSFIKTVRSIDEFLAPWTPSVLYLVVMPGLRHTATDILNGLSLKHTHTAVLTLEDTGWGSTPTGMDKSLWHGEWEEGYRLMGDWRLWHMQHYAHRRGHRYVLQVDLDSTLLGPIPYNIVDTFRAGRTWLGARAFLPDDAGVTWGLPELLRYHLLTEGLRPTGHLLGNCTPPNIHGLFLKAGGSWVYEEQLRVVAALGVKQRGGWNVSVAYGNFLVLDLRFWLSPPIQAFVRLVRGSGGNMRYRWNEQAVIGLLWHAFVPDAHLHVFAMDYAHKGVRLP